VKNEALEQSLNTKSWHLSLLKLKLGSIILLRANRQLIKLFSGYY